MEREDGSGDQAVIQAAIRHARGEREIRGGGGGGT